MQKEEIIKFFSEFWKIKESEVDESLVLNDENLKNHSSIRFYQFIAALESNFDVIVKNVENIFTLKDLINNISKKK